MFIYIISMDMTQETGFQFPWWIFSSGLSDVLLLGYPIFKLVAFLVRAVVKHYTLPMPDLKKRYCHEDKESWAVVTGATDGIGLGFCKVLVKMGFNIVLISRNPQKLSSTVEILNEIQKDRLKKSNLRTITFNFEDSSKKELVQAMLARLQGLDICLLINNVGTNFVGLHADITHKKVVDVANVNCVSMAVLTSKLIRRMNTRGKKSGIINLSSIAGDRGIPFLGLYSATKSFTNKLTEGLCLEYPNMDIMNLRPVLVESNLSKKKKGRFVPNGEQYALEGLKELVYESKSYGTLSHQIIGYIYYDLFPEFVFNNLITFILKKMFSVRRR